MKNDYKKDLFDYLDQIIKNNNLTAKDSQKARNLLAIMHHQHLFKYRTWDEKSKKFKKTTIEHLFTIYCFDTELRNALMQIIEIIEVNLKARLSYYLQLQYGQKCLFQKKNFLDIVKVNSTTNEKIHLYDLIIEHYKKQKPWNIDKQGQPIERDVYTVISQMTFGDICTLYEILKIEDKKYISGIYSTKFNKFSASLLCIKEIRNICAHFEHLYNRPLRYPTNLKKELSEYQASNKIFPRILVMKEMVNNKRKWNKFIKRIIDLVKNNLKNINLDAIDFFKNWEEVLTK